MSIKIRDLGRMDYDMAWDLQHQLFDRMVALKKRNVAVDQEWVLTVEHNPVVTLGKHAKENNLLISEVELNRQGVISRRIERGGDVTFHGHGQLVVYPIIDLEYHKIGVKKYVDILEEAVIQTISLYGIKGERIEGASGVWIGKGSDNERKICAIGVKCSRFCTMHGLALNVNTDLNWFRIINPCGFVDKGVTSIEVETGRDIKMDEVKGILVSSLLRLLNRRD